MVFPSEYFLYFIFSGSAAQRGLWPPHSRGFVITQHATVSRTPLDEWSARCRDLYLTTHTTNIHAPGGIWTHDHSRRVAVDLHLRPCGHWDQLFPQSMRPMYKIRGKGNKNKIADYGLLETWCHTLSYPRKLKTSNNSMCMPALNKFSISILRCKLKGAFNCPGECVQRHGTFKKGNKGRKHPGTPNNNKDLNIKRWWMSRIS
jgi:hypothetical protein